MNAPIENGQAMVECRKCKRRYTFNVWAAPIDVWFCWHETSPGVFCRAKNRLAATKLWDGQREAIKHLEATS